MCPLSLLAFDRHLNPRRADLLRRSVGLFGLLLVGATWRLWTPQCEFPQVPLFSLAIAAPRVLQWLVAAVMLASLFGMLLLPLGRWANAALLLFASAMAALIVFDQQRLQPWAYQFMLIAIVLAICSARSALMLLRLLIVGFYFESAVTKLDYSFLHSLGQQFLKALLGRFGGSVEGWEPAIRLAAAAVFPIGELLVGLGLLFAVTRRAAVWGAIMLHLVLLLILGPLGLDHKPGVLVWNAYFIVQDLLLFWAGAATQPHSIREAESERAPFLATALIAAALALPLLEPWGWFDTWPSWGLYASSAERVVLQIHRQGRDQLPQELETFLEVPADRPDPWLTLRLDRWALESLAAPIYPQNRVQLGIAQAVAGCRGLAQRARAVRLGRADRRTGERSHTVVQGAAQWDAVDTEYYFNTRPRQSVR